MAHTKGYLGIIAEIKAGKGTVFEIVSEALAHYGGRTQLINFSDSIGECIAGLHHITPNREAFQRMAMCVINGWDDGIWAKEVDFRARRSTADFVVLAGMRRPPELPLVRGLSDLGTSCVLYLTAPQEKRWQWLVAKGERPGDREKTWEQFQIEDNAPAEQRIREVGSLADEHIDNSGTLEDLECQVRMLLRTRFDID